MRNKCYNKGMSNQIRIDDDLPSAVKIAAIQDGKKMQAWLSDVVRAELNRRQENILKIKPLSPRPPQ